MQHVVVVRLAHRLPLRHGGKTLLEPVGEVVDRFDRLVAGLIERGAATLVERSAEWLNTLREQRIDGPRRLDCERGVEMNGLREIAARVLEHLRHRSKPRHRGRGADRRRVVLLFQQREDRVTGLGHVRTGIRLFGMQDAPIEIESLELGAEQDPVDLVILAPRRDVRAADGLQQRLDVGPAAGDRRGRIVGELRVVGVQSLIAAPHGKVLLPPVVEVDGG